MNERSCRFQGQFFWQEWCHLSTSSTFQGERSTPAASSWPLPHSGSVPWYHLFSKPEVRKQIYSEPLPWGNFTQSSIIQKWKEFFIPSIKVLKESLSPWLRKWNLIALTSGVECFVEQSSFRSNLKHRLLLSSQSLQMHAGHQTISFPYGHAHSSFFPPLPPHTYLCTLVSEQDTGIPQCVTGRNQEFIVTWALEPATQGCE